MKRGVAIAEKRRNHVSAQEGVVQALNILLCDEYLLTTKKRCYHWNVVSPQFHDLHKFFEHQYEELDKIVDEVAEHARAQGGSAYGSLEQFRENSRLEERANDFPDARTMISNLLHDHETIIEHLREDLRTVANQDEYPSTNNFLTEILTRHEKTAWMLRSCLEG